MFICAWQWMVQIEQDPTLISINKIINSLFTILTNNSFIENLLSTMKLILIGISIAIIFGVLCAIVMDMNKSLFEIINPIIELFRNIPSITLFPILLVIYGIGDASRIFVIFWTSYPSILLSTLYGLRNVNKEIIEASANCGANKYQTMLYIKFPLCIPDILNGIKIGIGSGFVAIVVAEMLGASKGLGYMVLWSTNSFKYSETYAYILIIGFIGAMMNYLMQLLIEKEERRLGR